MKSTWTIAQLEKLKADGKIRDFKLPDKPKEPVTGGRKVGQHFKKGDKAKDFIGWNLLIWCQERALVHEEEYRFHPERKWRFDWAIPALMIAIEYEGICSDVSRHTTARGYTGDSNKYNAAQGLGWKILRFTALNYTDLITELNKHV